MSERADGNVAQAAQQPTNSTSDVVVINGQSCSLCRWLAADGALIVVLTHECLVLLLSQAVHFVYTYEVAPGLEVLTTPFSDALPVPSLVGPVDPSDGVGGAGHIGGMDLASTCFAVLVVAVGTSAVLVKVAEITLTRATWAELTHTLVIPCAKFTSKRGYKMITWGV